MTKWYIYAGAAACNSHIASVKRRFHMLVAPAPGNGLLIYAIWWWYLLLLTMGLRILRSNFLNRTLEDSKSIFIEVWCTLKCDITLNFKYPHRSSVPSVRFYIHNGTVHCWSLFDTSWSHEKGYLNENSIFTKQDTKSVACRLLIYFYTFRYPHSKARRTKGGIGLLFDEVLMIT